MAGKANRKQIAQTNKKLFAQSLLKSSDPIKHIKSATFQPEDLIKFLKDKEQQARLLSFYSFHAHQNKDFKHSASLSLKAYQTDPKIIYLKNAVISARESKDIPFITKSLQLAEETTKDCETLTEQAMLYDVICHSYGDLGKLKKAAQFGTLALETKHKFATANYNQRQPSSKEAKRKNFDFYAPNKNIISYSLFGSQPRYTKFALENVKAARYIYPGWTCRFYIDDTVPPDTVKQLLLNKAQVLMRPHHNPKTMSGLFWRFEVASDENVDFFLIRDADSLITVKEKLAVDEWLLSDKAFHIMRDYYSQSELILAGLWGGQGGLIPNMAEQINHWHKVPKQKLLGQANQDQLFLREKIWPFIYENTLSHDSVFGFQSPTPFPALGLMEPVRHIGQNMGIFLKSNK